VTRLWMSLRFSLRTVRANSKTVRATKFKTSSRDHDGSKGSTPRVHRHRHRHRHTQAHTHNLLCFCFLFQNTGHVIKVAAVTSQGGYNSLSAMALRSRRSQCIKEQVPECCPCSAALARFSPQLAARRARTKRLGGPLGCGRCSTTQLPPASRR
jgi:hypothetical protein